MIVAKDLRIGLIGLDTSHVEGFTKVFHDKNDPNYISGGKVVIAYPGGSDDFAMSYNRIDKYTQLLREDYSVKITHTIEEVAEQSDAILITSVDGRIHEKQFEAIAKYKCPVFIDKPFATSVDSAKRMIELAKKYGTPLMSCSPLRFDESLTNILNDDTKGKIVGADCYGPMDLEDTQPGLFWYGIHTVEMLYTILGPGCKSVLAYKNKDNDVVVGEWEDGRVGVVRGNRYNNREFGSTIHRENGSLTSNSKESKRSFHYYQAKNIYNFMKRKESNVDLDTTLEIIKFIQATNESRKSGKIVQLSS